MANSVNNGLQPWWYQNELPESSLIPPGQPPYGGINNPWDIVKIAGIVLPGVSKVEVSSAIKINVKESAGKNFSYLTSEGYKPCDVIITTTIWTPEQWRDWQLNVLPNIKPLPAKQKLSSLALSIEHPACAAQYIFAICIETISGPTNSSEKGAKEFKIKATQYVKMLQDQVTKDAAAAERAAAAAAKAQLKPRGGNKPSAQAPDPRQNPPQPSQDPPPGGSRPDPLLPTGAVSPGAPSLFGGIPAPGIRTF
jgi:hypothetical protein